jgi:hypothetical protein
MLAVLLLLAPLWSGRAGNPRRAARFCQLFHADAQCFERPADHPAGMGIELCADGASQWPDVFHESL